MDTNPDLPEVKPIEEPKKSNKVWLIVIVVVVLFCCVCMCLVAAGGAALYKFRGENRSSNSEELQPNSTDAAPFFELPSLGGVELGHEIRAQYCGFSFKQIPEYEYTPLGCVMSISAPGVGDEGPYIALIGGTTDKEMTREEWSAEFLLTDEGEQIEQFKIKVDGKEGIGFDTEDTQNGIAVKGRVVSVYINSNQVFTIIGVTPADQWNEFKPKYEAVLKSVRFFTPEPKPTPTP
jgi:hypothetical protein